MYGILGEHDSDADAIDAIVRKIKGIPNLPVKKKGFSGCDDMCRSGLRFVTTFLDFGCDRFIICHDRDRRTVEDVIERVRESITRPAGLASNACIVVPVEELEAWLLADPDAIQRVLPAVKIKNIPEPERIAGPKEFLEKKSRDKKSRPRYVSSTDNPAIARELDLRRVFDRCPSFRSFFEFVAAG